MNQVEFSRTVLARENRICQYCSRKARVAHDPTGLHKDTSEGVALCDKCHKQVHTEGIAGRRVNLYFSEGLLSQLRHYVRSKYGAQRAMSLTVEQAVKEFLERHADKKS